MAWKLRNVGTSVSGIRAGAFWSTSGSRTNFPLNSAFVRGVSGAAIGCRYRCITNEPINEFYTFNDQTTGTRANVTMVCKLWNMTTTSTTQPGTTLLATSNTISLPATDDTWLRFVFPSPYTPAVGENVFFTVENLAAAPATDRPGIINSSAMDSGTNITITSGFSTTNGFSTAGTIVTELPHVILQGTNTVYGNPYTASGATGSFVGKRGILLSGDIKKLVPVYCRPLTTGGSWTGIQIYDLGTPPSGSALLTVLVNDPIDRLNGYCDMTGVNLSTLPGSGPFVVCATYSSTQATNGPLLIEDYASFPALFDRFSEDNFSFPPYVQETAGNWVVDRSRTGGLHIEFLDTYASGGGGASRPFHPFAQGVIG